MVRHFYIEILCSHPALDYLEPEALVNRVPRDSAVERLASETHRVVRGPEGPPCHRTLYL